LLINKLIIIALNQLSFIYATEPEILREEFLRPYNITAYKLAKDINVATNRITNIVNEKRNISPETGLLLSKYFGLSEDYWCNLQSHYDQETAKDKISKKLDLVKTLAAFLKADAYVNLHNQH
jgi:antitoxin HigA-1